ncbi:Uncharacterised protein [Salmonella enterica subsp. arizonae]|nr:Uncharacterised protein [Salmonella enterica subsp. arizonae]
MAPSLWITSSRRWITNTILPASYNPWRKEFFPSLEDNFATLLTGQLGLF